MGVFMLPVLSTKNLCLAAIANYSAFFARELAASCKVGEFFQTAAPVSMKTKPRQCRLAQVEKLAPSNDLGV